MSLTLSIPAVLIGFLAGFFLRRFLTSRSVAQAEAKAQQILAESKTKGQEVLLEANRRALEMLESAKHEEADRRKQLDKIENLLTKKEM